MEAFLLLCFALIVVSSIILFVESLRIKKLTLEYDKSKNLLKDIIFSFNDQLKLNENEVKSLKEKISKLVKDKDEILTTLKSYEEAVLKIPKDLQEYNSFKEKIIHELESLKDSLHSLREKYDLLESRIHEIFKSEGELERKVVESGILVTREGVLGSLNETEINVLKFLAEEGEKTANQIRDRFKLSREHSSRLLKKLYERGYLERSTRGKPYLYGIKREMKEFLENM